MNISKEEKEKLAKRDALLKAGEVKFLKLEVELNKDLIDSVEKEARSLGVTSEDIIYLALHRKMEGKDAK